MTHRWTETFRGVVKPEQCDMMEHLTTREYSAFFGPASWGYLEKLGYLPDEYKLQRLGMVDVLHTTRFIRELRSGDEAYVLSAVKKIGETSITVQHRLMRASDDMLCAEFESVSVQFDLDRRAKVPLAPVLRQRAEKTLGLVS